ncbi:AMIN domain-containing protein [Desulforhopalus sp. 52FAK]
MKLVSLLAVAIIGLFLFSPSLLLAESESLVEIESIAHSKQSEEQETVQFKLAAEIPVRMFALKGDRPRLVIDFPEAIYKGQNVIALADGELANTIRIGLHKEPKSKARIVIDLSKSYAVDYKHSFLESENLLEVVLRRGEKLETVAAVAEKKEPAKKEVVSEPVKSELVGDKAAVVKTPAAVETPKVVEEPVVKEAPAMMEKVMAKELDSRPVDEKPIPPAVMVVAEEQTVADTGDVPPGLPQLLEVSFDDSSNRGEMVLFHLNDFFPPTVSALEKNKPRILCDFKNMRLSRDVQTTIDAKGKYVEGIRTAYHADKDKVRVVLDLSPDRDYDLQQVFFKNDNLFVLIVNELPAENTAQ